MIWHQFLSPCLFCSRHCLPGTSPVWLLHHHHDHPHHHQPHHHDHHDHHRLTATPPATPLKTSASSASLSACPSILPACSNRPDSGRVSFEIKTQCVKFARKIILSQAKTVSCISILLKKILNKVQAHASNTWSVSREIEAGDISTFSIN